MARGLGVKVAPAVAAVADIAGLGGVAIAFNLLSIIIDIVPLCVLVFVVDWKEAKKYFTVQGFAAGAVLNLMLIGHVLFVADDQHPDVLFVSAVGFVLGTVYAFFLLTHLVITADGGARLPRVGMAVLLTLFVIACGTILSGILMHYKSKADARAGQAILWTLFVAVVVLNALTLFPIITCKAFPDQQSKYHSFCMCFMNLIDSTFFVFYSKAIQSADGVLSLVSMINATCAVIQLLALAISLIPRFLRKVGVRLRSFGQSCGGFFRIIALILDLHGE